MIELFADLAMPEYSVMRFGNTVKPTRIICVSGKKRVHADDDLRGGRNEWRDCPIGRLTDAVKCSWL